jgi:hypothetical protein
MNELIKELLKRAGVSDNWNSADWYSMSPEMVEKFAELIVKEHLNILRQEWYDLNNLPSVTDESPRDIGLRVGKKGEIIVLSEKIKTHFGVKE